LIVDNDREDYLQKEEDKALDHCSLEKPQQSKLAGWTIDSLNSIGFLSIDLKICLECLHRLKNLMVFVTACKPGTMGGVCTNVGNAVAALVANDVQHTKLWKAMLLLGGQGCFLQGFYWQLVLPSDQNKRSTNCEEGVASMQECSNNNEYNDTERESRATQLSCKQKTNRPSNGNHDCKLAEMPSISTIVGPIVLTLTSSNGTIDAVSCVKGQPTVAVLVGAGIPC
jgi:hypothetical protein